MNTAPAAATRVGLPLPAAWMAINTTRAFLNRLSLNALPIWASSNGPRRRDQSSDMVEPSL